MREQSRMKDMRNTMPETVKYNVTGMSCAACQAHVEKAVRGVEGVTSCEVSLLTNSMSVSGEAASEKIIEAVQNAGYCASVSGSSEKGTSIRDMEKELEYSETPVLVKRLISSAVILLILMYFSMGVMMFGWPAPSGLAHNMTGIAALEMILSLVIMVINGKFFTSGIRSALHGAPNMDTLVAMGSGVSFLYSIVTLVKMSSADHSIQMELMNELYFESAAMILTLITVGKTLESVSKGRTTDALKSLMKLAPDTAIVIRYGKEVKIPAEEVAEGDIYVVYPGESIPVDGTVIEGTSSVNESALTGESIPVDKEAGDSVYAACINMSGFIKCRADKVGTDTTLAKIIEMVRDASASKAPIARIADRVSGIFVPSVIGIAAFVFLLWLLLGAELPYALTRAIAVLVVSCPCALGLATPVAVMVGNGVAAKNGILFKTSSSLEEAGKSDTAVFDKTGTVTEGEPSVTDVEPACDVTGDELLEAAYSLERKSEHPLGKAVVIYSEEKKVTPFDVDDFQIHPGNGLEGKKDGKRLFGGNISYIGSKVNISEEIKISAEKLSKVGKTPLLFSTEEKFLGIIAVSDRIKETSAQAVSELKKLGLSVIMLTGDNETTGKAIADKAGIDTLIAGVLPDGKEKVIRDLKRDSRVLMVGDGINDAPALTAADTGMAIGSGTDVAIDAGDVVLMRSSLLDVCAAIRLSRKTLTVIHENLFWAFIYNVLLIPVAAGAYSRLGLEMSPMFGAAAMSISSFTVCMNALRLNLFDPYDNTKDRPVRKKKKEKTMTKTISIEGMMCAHCEASVKKALEALEGVESAEASHEKGTAIVTLSGDVSDDILKKAVEDKDYKVTGIE